MNACVLPQPATRVLKFRPINQEAHHDRSQNRLTLKSANVLDVESGALIGSLETFMSKSGIIREISQTDVTKGEIEIDLDGLHS